MFDQLLFSYMIMKWATDLFSAFSPKHFEISAQEPSTFLFLSDKTESVKVICVQSKCMCSRLHSHLCVLGIESNVEGCSVLTLDIKGWAVNPKLNFASLCWCVDSFYLQYILSGLVPACSTRGGSLCQETTPIFGQNLMETSTSPTRLLTMQASTSVLPPVLWAMPVERSSSV